MSGIENDVFLMKNVNFDYTSAPPHNGIVTADGQLLIGTTTNPNIAMVANTLTAGTGITITNAPGSITIASSAAASDLHVARFIVASSTAGTGANFTTISAAIAAAQGTGINSTIFIQPGTYTENLTLVPGINLCAFDCDSTTPNVTIIGTLTHSTAGTVSISGIRLQTNGAAAIAVTGAAASILNLNNCYFNFTNSTGITFSSASSSARLYIFNTNGDLGATGGIFAHSSAGILVLDHFFIQNTSASTVVNTCSAGLLNMQYYNIQSPVTISGSAALTLEHGLIDTNALNLTALTHGGGASSCKWSRFGSGSASAISISGTLGMEFCTIFTSNTNAITGAGTLVYSCLSFDSTSSTINTTTQAPLVTTNDAIKIVTPAAYPYTTTPQDALIKVDTSSARTITPLASPTTGQQHIIKDTVGSAAANNITVTPSGKNIDGAASYVINSNYASITIVYNGTEWSVI